MDPQAIQKKKEAYVEDFIRKVDKAPEELSKHELRIGTRFRSARENADKIGKDITQIKEQITQGEARLRSMELQVQQEVGKANGFLEAILAFNFDDDDEMSPDAGVMPPKGGNGKPLPEPTIETPPKAAHA
jgi:chromosome segregation ATPase